MATRIRNVESIHVRKIYLLMDPSIHRSMDPSLPPSIHASMHPSIHLSIYGSIYRSIDLSISLSLSVCLSIYLSLYLSIYLPISLCLSLSLSHSLSFSVFLSISLCAVTFGLLSNEFLDKLSKKVLLVRWLVTCGGFVSEAGRWSKNSAAVEQWQRRGA